MHIHMCTYTCIQMHINQLLLMSSGTISPRNSISPSFPFSLSLFPSSAAAFILIRWAFCQLSLSQCFLFSPCNLHWSGIAMIICVCVGETNPMMSSIVHLPWTCRERNCCRSTYNITQAGQCHSKKRYHTRELCQSSRPIAVQTTMVK